MKFVTACAIASAVAIGAETGAETEVEAEFLHAQGHGATNLGLIGIGKGLSYAAPATAIHAHVQQPVCYGSVQ